MERTELKASAAQIEAEKNVWRRPGRRDYRRMRRC